MKFLREKVSKQTRFIIQSVVMDWENTLEDFAFWCLILNLEYMHSIFYNMDCIWYVNTCLETAWMDFDKPFDFTTNWLDVTKK